jgi:GNAT superfamily N-acetyltransferase
MMRDANAQDAPEIARLIIRTKERSFPAGVTDHDRNFDFWRERWRYYIENGSPAQKSLGDGFVILAEHDGKLTGFAAYHHTRRWDCDAELESIYVDFDYQRRGIGSMLLREAVERLRRDGSTSLCVGYSSDNPYKRFYQKHGAQEIHSFWAVWRELPNIPASSQSG